MRTNAGAITAARLIGILTLGWAYLAATDLRWLLHLHKVHALLTKAPLSFSYGPYLAVNLANLAASLGMAGALIFFPGWLFRVFTPKAENARLLSAVWVTICAGLGMMLVVLSVHGILATTLWTIYSGGRNQGWTLEIAVSGMVAIGGMVLFRKALAGVAR